MDLQSFTQQLVSIAGTFTPNLVIFLFVLLVIGELGFGIPYVLETVWMIIGYNIISGNMLPSEAILLLLTAAAGREAGATIIYFVSRLGSAPLVKLYNKLFASQSKVTGRSNIPALLRSLTTLTPFSVAMGRLMWLRAPLTLTLAVKKQFGILLAGVLLSSLAWDMVYILLGMIGGTTRIKPSYMVLFSLAFLTVLYLAVFLFRRFVLHPAAQDKTERIS